MKCDRKSEHIRTDAKRFYYLSHAICYSYGADDKISKCYNNLAGFVGRLDTRIEPNPNGTRTLILGPV